MFQIPKGPPLKSPSFHSCLIAWFYPRIFSFPEPTEISRPELMDFFCSSITPLDSLFLFPSESNVSFLCHAFHFGSVKEGGCERCSVTLIEAKCVLSTRKHWQLHGRWEQANVQEIKGGWMRRCSEIILEGREKWLHWKFAIVNIQVPSKSLDWSTQMEGVLSVISLCWQNEN